MAASSLCLKRSLSFPRPYSSLVSFVLLFFPLSFHSHRALEKDGVGIAELIKKAINQCDLDVRRSLWENILIAGPMIATLVTSLLHSSCCLGGSSMFPGFIERLEAELKKLAPDNTVPVLNVVPNRYLSFFDQ